MKKEIEIFLREHFNRTNRGIKLALSANCTYKNERNADEFTHYNHSDAHVFLCETDINLVEDTIIKNFRSTFNLQLEFKSGAKLEKITNPTIELYRFAPICVGTYLPTPKAFAKKKAIINIKNDSKVDANLCFHYSILAYKN